MGRRTAYAPGTPCWVDLSTPDVAAAEAFYAVVFGWTTRPAEVGDYVVFEHGGAAVAGLSRLTGDQRRRGMPAAWSMYVSVADVEAAAAHVAELGGAVAVAPLAIDGAGRMAAAADPQGGIFLLWEPLGFAGAELVNAVGAWSWNDLQTADPEGAAPFYEQLFGWATAEVPGSDGVYRSIAHEGRAIGGILRTPASGAPPAWTVYVGVADLDATLERVSEAGGRMLVPPAAVPAGRFAVAADPQRAVVCLVESEFDD